ncbi:MAG: response regulator transcription factor [Elusimicrobia bacterium]|nr:response regulator transcription factor [Elusimicrobiota bacterium]
MRARVLAVEDDAPATSRLKELLVLPEFVLRVERRLEPALAAAFQWEPEVVLLSDRPRAALELLGSLKHDARTAATPVFWLSSGDEGSALGALAQGAVTYLVRPYEPEELVARLRAIVRHFRAASGRDGTLRFGPLILDRPGRRVYLAGRAVELAPKEFETLEYLAESAGRVLSRRQILERVWGFDNSSGPRTVDYHVFQLRKKLGARLSSAIDTVSRVGYCFRPESIR